MQWRDFQDKHKGETGLVICNGPSLLQVPNSFLSRYPSIGTNGIYELPFQPTYYAAINELVIQQFDINQVTGQRFVRKAYAEQYNALPLISGWRDGEWFSKTPDVWICEGGTVTYVALQLAYFMGFQTVLMVGLDHYYQNNHGAPNEEQVMDEDKSHFTKNYFKKGMKWNLPDLAASEMSYREAKRVYEEAGRKIINLTEGTAEDIFEKGLLKDYQDA